MCVRRTGCRPRGRAPSTGGTSAPADAVALTPSRGVLAGAVASFRGTAPTRVARRIVTVERFDVPTQAWIAVATALVVQDGSYLAR